MAEYKLILPEMGESVAEATVINWVKQVGDTIDIDDSVVEIATDKVDSDVPSPVNGVLKEILVEVDGIAKVGEPIAILEIEGGVEENRTTAAPEKQVTVPNTSSQANENKRSNYELILPEMGESVAEATVINWVKQVGDTIDIDDSIVEIATDKVDSDVPSPVNGVLKEILIDVDGIAQVGKPIAIIEIAGAINTNTTISSTSSPAKEVVASLTEPLQDIKEINTAINFSDSDNFYSPLVKNIAKQEGISIQELEQISGTGKSRRVTKTDILSYVKSGKKIAIQQPMKKETAVANTSVKKEIGAVPLASKAGDEIIKMDRMRKLIAKYMVDSKHTAPHVSSFVETDVTNIVKWRNANKNGFLKREGEKLTFTPIFVSAVVKAIKDFPMINVSVDGDHIIKKKNINIGIATALPSGNLIVPVIKNADQYSLSGLAKKINDLANRARHNKLKPDEIQGGTYTISNIGGFGNILGTPIINQPEVAILAIGAIEKKPAVIETLDGDMIAIRHKMYLSHSYDHRVVDGALGGMFVKRVSDYLEQFSLNTEV